MSDQCCSCPAIYNRCKTEDCPCFNSGKICQNNCETTYLSANCLNRPVCRCTCVPGPGTLPPNGPHSKSGSRATSSASISTQHTSPQIVPGAPPSYCDSSRCECYRYREPCSSQCGCKRLGCSHSISTDHLYKKPKQERPSKGCKCSSGKRGCTKQKCSCRQHLDHCSKNCKCGSDCANDKNVPLSKPVRSCFFFPDQETTGTVVRLLGQHGCLYQMEFMNIDKNLIHGLEVFYETILNVIATFHIPIHHIQVFMSKSPCFHQDCEPRCEVLQHCESQKACARLLSVAYGQLQRHMGTCELQMSVKFLSPYVKRGDLYTQQGILNMMEAGIHVEPLNLKEWTEILLEPPVHTTNVLMMHWAENQLESLVRQSQHYINTCRRSLGQKQNFWTSGFHDLLKTTVMTCASTQQKFDAIAYRLVQQKETEAALAALRSDTRLPSMETLMTESGAGASIYQNSLMQESLMWSHTLPLGVSTAYGVICDMENPISGSNTVEALNFSPIHGGGSTKKLKKQRKVRRSLTGSNLSTIAKHRDRSESHERNRDRSLQRTLSPTRRPPPPPPPPPPQQEIGEDLTPTNTARPSNNDGGIFDPIEDETIIGADEQREINEGGFQIPLSPECVERIVLNFSGRSISEQERKEMREELSEAVDILREKTAKLLRFLDQRSSATLV